MLIVAVDAAARAPSASRSATARRATSRARSASPTIAIVIAMLLSVGSYFAGDKLVLAASGAKEVTQESGAAADERRPGDRARRRTCRCPRCTSSRTRRRTPSPPGVTRSTRRSPSPPACSRSSIARSSRASWRHELGHVRNYDIRFSLLVAVLVGSIALMADFFLRFTFWGGGRRGGGDRDKRRRGTGRDPVHRRDRPRGRRADHRRGFVQLAVSRQREYLADATSVELTRNPRGLERALAKIAARPGGPRGRQPRHAAPVLHEPDQEVRGALELDVLDAPERRRADQPPAPADAASRRSAGATSGRSPASTEPAVDRLDDRARQRGRGAGGSGSQRLVGDAVRRPDRRRRPAASSPSSRRTTRARNGRSGSASAGATRGRARPALRRRRDRPHPRDAPDLALRRPGGHPLAARADRAAGPPGERLPVPAASRSTTRLASRAAAVFERVLAGGRALTREELGGALRGGGHRGHGACAWATWSSTPS